MLETDLPSMVDMCRRREELGTINPHRWMRVRYLALSKQSKERETKDDQCSYQPRERQRSETLLRKSQVSASPNEFHLSLTIAGSIMINVGLRSVSEVSFRLREDGPRQCSQLYTGRMEQFIKAPEPFWNDGLV